MIVSSAFADELSLYPYIMEDVARYESAGDRFTLFSTSGGEHVITEAEDGFSTQVAALDGAPRAAADPGTIDYTWCPQVVEPALGLGPSSVYWLSGLSQQTTTSTSPGSTALSHVVADDRAIPEPAETEVTSASVAIPFDAPPMEVLTGKWAPAETPPPASVLDLTLTNVATLTVDAAAARLPHGTASVTSEGPTRLTLTHLSPGARVLDCSRVLRVGADGQVSIPLPSGTSMIAWL